MAAKVYYNEYEPFAAAWLRRLVAQGIIPAGDVDDRSIVEVAADDLKGYTQLHFFAGIGGWAEALRLAGWDDRPVWTGSCPCQPFSAAGRRRGADDPRHLWPAWFRLIREHRPAVILGEQVANPDGVNWLEAVLADLEGVGYAVGAADLCAAGIGAPHLRQRLWFVGNASGERRDGQQATQGTRGRRGVEGAGPTRLVGHAEGDGRRKGWPESAGVEGRPPLARSGVAGGLADAGRDECERRDALRGAIGGAPEASGRREGAEADRERPQPDAADDGAGGVADGEQPGLEGHARDVGDRDEPRRVVATAARSAAEGGAADVVSLADAENRGRREVEREPEHRAEQGAQGGEPLGRGDDGRFPWTHVEWLPCRDGRYRPTQPGLFPLADGIPGRVGRLRAYGNAIVPQVGAAFARAVLDVIG